MSLVSSELFQAVALAVYTVDYYLVTGQSYINLTLFFYLVHFEMQSEPIQFDKLENCSDF